MSRIVMLVGPIGHWWDDNWETPEHWHYAAWRQKVSDALVAEGYLVYRPHEGFKGAWDERAQAVNDAALCASDVILNLSPPDVPSPGTEAELLHAATHSAATVISAPPPVDAIHFDEGIVRLLDQLQDTELLQRGDVAAGIRQGLANETTDMPSLEPRVVRASIRYRTNLLDPADNCGGSACADLVFDDGTTKQFGWYHDELTFTTEDFVGKTLAEIKRMHYERDMEWLRS